MQEYRQILQCLQTGIVIFEGKKLRWINDSAKVLLGIDDEQEQPEELGPYAQSLEEFLTLKKHNYQKTLTGKIGKPLNATSYTLDQQQIIEISESHESKLGEASHELRRPLTNIKTLVDTLYLWGAGEDPDARQRFLSQLHSQVERLTSTLNDLLNLSRLQAGSSSLKTQKISLKALTLECFEQLSEQAQQKDLNLQCQARDQDVLIADLDKITHVLQNLIENAIRYNSPQGQVIVQALSPNGFVVSDTGCGIDPENISSIFERFKRANKEIPGTGLGLSIVKTIVDLHGGEIEVASTPGQGSKFSVSLPPRQIINPPA